MVSMRRGVARIAAAVFVLAGLDVPGVADQWDADVVILGEVHDNREAHLRQARMIEKLRPMTIVFEMLSAEAAQRASQADRSDPAAIALATQWGMTDWPAFELYAPIFMAGRSAWIEGGGVSREDARRAIFSSAFRVFGPDGRRFGLDRPLPRKEQAARETLKAKVHCGAMPAVLMRGFVEAQRLRDAALARAVLAALEAHGPPVALIAGHGHARKDWGVPRLIALAAPEVKVHSIAYVETQSDAPFDETVLVPATQRDDPCAQLRQR